MSKIGIIAAMSSEARLLAGQRIKNAHITQVQNHLIYVSGMGDEKAEVATRKLIEHGAIALISWGTAGSLSPSATPGDLLLPETVITPDTTYRPDQSWRERLEKHLIDHQQPLNSAAILSGSGMVDHQEEKAELFQQTHCVAVDMESAAIARVASEFGIPFIVVRAVVDAHDQAIPDLATNAINAFGEVRAVQLSKGLISQPASLRDLIKLGQHFELASKTLKNVIQLCPESLCFPATE